MSTSSPTDPAPDQSTPRPQRTSRDGGFSIWHSHVTDGWEARIAIGTSVLDLVRGLSMYLPGGVRLVDTRPDDGSGMALLVFEPDEPDGVVDRMLAADRAELGADLATLNLEAGRAAIVGTQPDGETTPDAAGSQPDLHGASS